MIILIRYCGRCGKPVATPDQPISTTTAGATCSCAWRKKVDTSSDSTAQLALLNLRR